MEEKKLTDEQIIKDIERSTGMPSYWKTIVLDLINRQKAEIKRLTEELETKKKECREIADDYQEMGTFYYNETVKSDELQKQVDELTEKLGKVLSGIKADELLVAKGVEQAVKDTAKEIIAAVKDCMRDFEDDDDGYLLKKGEFEFFMREIAKLKGVEVE